MSEIITFMFEPAKLQMNCARARGAISLRMDARDRSPVEGGLTDTDRSVTRLPYWSQSGRRAERHHPEEMRWKKRESTPAQGFRRRRPSRASAGMSPESSLARRRSRQFRCD